MSESIRKIMNLQAESERQKRAYILTSEGEKQSLINQAYAQKKSYIMQSEAEGQRIYLQGHAISDRITRINTIIEQEGEEAIKFKLAENYIDALKGLEGKSIMIKADLNNPEKLVNLG